MTNDNSRDLAEMNDDVALLVRLAGPTGLTGPVAAERNARVRAAVYGAWSEQHVGRQARQARMRRRLTIAMLFAAAASVVIAVAIFRRPAPVQVAHVDRVTEQAAGSSHPFRAGDVVLSGSTITTSAGTVAMTLKSGVQLKLDASSTAVVDSATDLRLVRGAVY